jgi:hypothetical protein
MLQTTPQESDVVGKAAFVVGRPVRTAVAVVYNFMDFSAGRIKCRTLPNPPATKKAKSIKKPKSSDAAVGEVSADIEPDKKSGLKKRGSIFRRKSKTADEEQPNIANSEKKWVCPVYPVLRVAVAKRDEPGFGMTLTGPDKPGSKTGVYISKVKPNGPVAIETEGTVVAGMRVIAMNGKVSCDTALPLPPLLGE